MITVLGFVNIYPVSVAYGLPGSGETLSGKEFYTALGGKGANQALAARRAGRDVRMVGAIGAVDFGSAAISALQDAGVDLSTMERSAGFTGTAVICVEYGRENTITVVPGAYGPINRILLQSGPVLKVELKIPYSNTQTMERGLRAES